MNDYNYEHDDVFADVLWLRDEMKPYYKEEFHLNDSFVDSMEYYWANRFADYIFSERFEGIPQEIDWTGDQIRMINDTFKYALINPLNDLARRVWVSRILETPLREIETLISGNGDSEIPNYRIYSAHDENIANMITQIYPSWNYTYIPYAASLFIELHKSTASNSYFVKTYYDEHPALFPECHPNMFMCKVDQYLDIMRSRLIVDDD